MRYSIRARLTLWYGALMTLVLAVFSAGVIWLHAYWGAAQFDTELANLGAAVSRVMQEELGESGNLERAARETRSSTDVPGRATAVLRLDGRPLEAHWQSFHYDPATFDALRSRPGFVTLSQEHHAWRLFLQRDSSPAGDYFVFVGGTLDQIARQRALLARVVLVATPILVLASAAVCWGVASAALHPVRAMAVQAEAITERSASRRLATPTPTDELGQLARAFNGLLDRLDAALKQQRQFMADASHELRTPVSVIQTATEVTLEPASRAEWEYRDALTIVGEQCGRLRRMVEDMLVLARADAGGVALAWEPLYADEVVAECVRAVALVAGAREIQVSSDIQPDVLMHADNGLLHQLTTNLLQNAVQYTPPGGRVVAAVKADSTAVTISVSDTGPGIPAADRERVFDRFVRLDAARSATTGAGLGLSIARWIAERHGGTISVESNAAGGCLFVVCLPRAGRPVDTAV